MNVGLGVIKEVEIVDDISYIGVTLACSGVRNKRKSRLMAEGNETVVVVDKGLARQDMKLKMLENVYEVRQHSQDFLQGGNELNTLLNVQLQSSC